jgi:hypothetical protein
LHQADVFYLGAHFYHQGRTFDFKVFDHCNGVAIRQQVAHCIAHGFDFLGIFCRRPVFGPFVAAFGADVKPAVFIG